MNKEPIDTWELAELLEVLAKQLKKAPKFTLAKRIEEISQPTPIRARSQDYESLTVVKLKKECRKRGIKGYSRLKKAELVKILEENDKGITTIDKISVAFSDTRK